VSGEMSSLTSFGVWDWEGKMRFGERFGRRLGCG
jgi:hypothetical protein